MYVICRLYMEAITIEHTCRVPIKAYLEYPKYLLSLGAQDEALLWLRRCRKRAGELGKTSVEQECTWLIESMRDRIAPPVDQLEKCELLSSMMYKLPDLLPGGCLPRLFLDEAETVEESLSIIKADLVHAAEHLEEGERSREDTAALAWTKRFLGDISYVDGNRNAAMEHWKEMISLWKGIEPESDDERDCFAHTGLRWAYHMLHRQPECSDEETGESIDRYADALTIYMDLAKRSPDRYLPKLLFAESLFAGLCSDVDDTGGAAEVLKTAIDRGEEAPEEVKKLFAASLAICHLEFAKLYLKLNNTRNATEECDLAEDQIQLAGPDLRLLRKLADIRTDIARTLWKMDGHISEKTTCFLAATAAHTAVSAVCRNYSELDEAKCHRRLGELYSLVPAGYDAAIRELLHAKLIYEEYAEMDKPYYLPILLSICRRLMRLYIELGNDARADELMEELPRRAQELQEARAIELPDD